MAQLKDLDLATKAAWYRGQATMNNYPSYDEFLAYLNNPPVSTYDGCYVKTKAEQTEKVNEAWKRVEKDIDSHHHIEWFDNIVLNERMMIRRRERVHLPWWNPYENREWTLEEVSPLPNEVQDCESYEYNDYQIPDERMSRIIYVPHKVTGKPTKQGHTQYAYHNPVTGGIEWFGDFNQRGYENPLREWYLADADPLNKSPSLDKMELMHPIKVYRRIDLETYHDNSPASSEDPMAANSEKKRVQRHENAKSQYEMLLKNSMAGLTSKRLKDLEKHTKAAARERWPMWSKKKYTNTGELSDITSIFNVIVAIRCAQQFSKIKAITVGAHGRAKLLRTVITEPVSSSSYSYPRNVVADNKRKEWQREQIINLHDYGTHLSDLEDLSKKPLIAWAKTGLRDTLKELNKNILKEKATIKKNEDPVHLAKEVAKRLKTLEERVKHEFTVQNDRAKQQLRHLEEQKKNTKGAAKVIAAGGQEPFRHKYLQQRYMRDTIHRF